MKLNDDVQHPDKKSRNREAFLATLNLYYVAGVLGLAKPTDLQHSVVINWEKIFK